MRRGATFLLAGLMLAAALPAPGLAQPMPPPAIRPPPPAESPVGSLLAAPALPAVPVPTISPQAPSGPEALSLSASFAGDTRPIRSGLVWRIFQDGSGGAMPEMVAKLTDPTPTPTLAPGPYVVHVAYGLASATKRITIGGGPSAERLVIPAGALRLHGAIGEVPIATDRLSFSVYQPLPNDSEGKLVAASVKAEELVRLPEGTYHVVSVYGDSNAIMRADLKVDRGRVTDATLNHKAATMTLKLVMGTGGEAFAGTAFSVLTPGGDVIREAIGAFPRVTLAEGEYVLIARHNGKVYTREFKVESGLDHDVEVQVTPG